MLRIPRVVREWWERWNVLATMRSFRHDDKIKADFACAAQLNRLCVIARGDRKVAWDQWQQVRATYPNIIGEYEQAVKFLLELGEHKEAEQLLEERHKAHPSDPIYLERLAWVAQDRRDYLTAIERWALVRRKFPERSLGYSRAAECLARSARFNDAEALMAGALRRFPDEQDTRRVHARLAQDQENWEVALQRFELLHTMGERVASAIGRGYCLRKLGRLDEAEALYHEASLTKPSPDIYLGELARMAEERGDWAEAALRWEKVTRRFPSKSFGFVQRAKALRHAGQPEAAAQILAEAIGNIPDDAVLTAEYEQAKRAAAGPVPNWLAREGYVCEGTPEPTNRSVQQARQDAENATRIAYPRS
jgi:predicted Zn-dependent protease